MRLEVRLASPARSWSKPTSMVSSAVTSSASSRVRRVWGMVRAASAMTAASLRVGLGLAGVEVGDPPHRESGQAGDLAAGVAGDGQRQGADGGGLVHDQQNRAELGLELVEDGPQLRFAVGQRLVEDRLPGRGQAVAVMRVLADVQAQEDAHPVDADHRAPTCVDACRPRRLGPFARIHVMQTCRPRAAGHCARPGGGRTSDQRLRRHPSSPVTPPPGHPFDREQQSCRARRPAALLQDCEKHNGGQWKASPPGRSHRRAASAFSDRPSGRRSSCATPRRRLR